MFLLDLLTFLRWVHRERGGNKSYSITEQRMRLGDWIWSEGKGTDIRRLPFYLNIQLLLSQSCLVGFHRNVCWMWCYSNRISVEEDWRREIVVIY